MFSCTSCTFIKKTILFPLNCIATIVKKLTINVWAYFWTLSSVLLIYASTLMSLPQCLNDHNFVVSSKIKCGSVSPPIALFFFKIIFITLGLLHFHINLKTSLPISVKKAAEILTEAALNPSIQEVLSS